MALALPRWLVGYALRIAKAAGVLEWGVRRLRPFLADAHILHDRVPHAGRFLQLRWISKGPIDRHRVIIYTHGVGLPDALQVDFAARLAHEASARVMMPESGASDAAGVLALYMSLLGRGYAAKRISLIAEGQTAREAFAAMIQAAQQEMPLPGAFVSLSGQLPMDGHEIGAGHFPPSLLLCSGSEAHLSDIVALADTLGQTGVDVRLEVWRGLPAGWPILAAVLRDGRLAISHIARFLTLSDVPG